MTPELSRRVGRIMNHINSMSRGFGPGSLSQRIIDAVEASKDFDDLPDWARAVVIEAERIDAVGRKEAES